MTYLDTSALVKRYVTEKGSAALRRLLRRNELAATATIAYAETYSGLTRRYREGGLSTPQYTHACQSFERDWTELVRVELREEILVGARALIQRHVLRGFDAIHLASALSLQVGLDQPVTLVAADERLLGAAARERVATLDIETGRAVPST